MIGSPNVNSHNRVIDWPIRDDVSEVAQGVNEADNKLVSKYDETAEFKEG